MTPHFSLEEVEHSNIAERMGIPNKLPPHLAADALFTACSMEEVRRLLGKPIPISSWYRSPRLNSYIGGAKNSQHMLAQAVDFICPAFGTPYKVAEAIRNSSIQFDQLIYEYSWIHISFVAGRARREVLTKQQSSKGYLHGLVDKKGR